MIWLLMLAVVFGQGGAGASDSEATLPFGLSAGMGLEEVQERLGPVSVVGPFAYLGAAPEGAYDEIATLALIVTPEEGLCRIQATSDVIPADGAGTELQEVFGRLLERLWAEHGEPKVVDTLLPNSSLAAKDQWLEALLAGDRVVLSVWNRERGSRLAEGLESVVLAARGLEPGKGYLSVEYVFSSWPGCEARLESPPRDSAPGKRVR